MSYRLFIVVLVSLHLTGCMALFSSPSTLDYQVDRQLLWQERQTILRHLSQWEVRGRTAVNQGNTAWQAGLNWQESPLSYRIRIMGPFSQGGVKIDGNRQQVVLTTNDGRQLTAGSAEQLLREHYQLDLPVSALRDWIRGLPHLGLPTQGIDLDPLGQITLLKQQDWVIEYPRYIPYDTMTMPKKLLITHPKLSLKIIINRWYDVR